MSAITCSDVGTENVLLAACQMFLRWNHVESLATEKTHMYRISMANQIFKLTTDKKLTRECLSDMFSLQYF